MDWLALPTLSALRAFAAFAEAGTLVEAGRKLNVSHAAISQQLRALEDHLGLRLLSREGRQLTLTAEGERLADAVTSGFATMARAVEELTGADADRPLHVTTTPMFATTWLMPRLPEFQHRHPDIDLMLNPTAALADPEPGGIDIALRFGAGNWPGLEAEMLVATHLVVVAATSLVGEQEFTDPAQLLGYPWLQEIGSTEAQDWLHRHGVTEAALRSNVQMPGNLILEGARAGQGIAITAQTSIQSDVDAGRLRMLFQDEGDTGYFIVARPGVLRPAAKAFRGWLRQHARTLRQSRP